MTAAPTQLFNKAKGMRFIFFALCLSDKALSRSPLHNNLSNDNLSLPHMMQATQD